MTFLATAGRRLGTRNCCLDFGCVLCPHLRFLFMPLPAISRRRHTVFGLSIRERKRVLAWSYAKSLWTQYHALLQFHQIYNFNAVGDIGELVRVWGQKVQCQGHAYGQVSTLGGNFLTYRQNTGTYFNVLVTDHNCSLLRPHDPDLDAVAPLPPWVTRR